MSLPSVLQLCTIDAELMSTISFMVQSEVKHLSGNDYRSIVLLHLKQFIQVYFSIPVFFTNKSSFITRNES